MELHRCVLETLKEISSSKNLGKHPIYDGLPDMGFVFQILPSINVQNCNPDRHCDITCHTILIFVIFLSEPDYERDRFQHMLSQCQEAYYVSKEWMLHNCIYLRKGYSRWIKNNIGPGGFSLRFSSI